MATQENGSFAGKLAFGGDLRGVGGLREFHHAFDGGTEG